MRDKKIANLGKFLAGEFRRNSLYLSFMGSLWPTARLSSRFSKDLMLSFRGLFSDFFKLVESLLQVRQFFHFPCLHPAAHELGYPASILEL